MMIGLGGGIGGRDTSSRPASIMQVGGVVLRVADRGGS